MENKTQNTIKFRPKTDCVDLRKNCTLIKPPSIYQHSHQAEPLQNIQTNTLQYFNTIIYANNQHYYLTLGNQKMVKRINNPKRDKIIVDSLHSVKRKERKTKNWVESREEGRQYSRGSFDKKNYKENKENKTIKSRRGWGTSWVHSNLIQKWPSSDSQQKLLKEQENQRMQKRIMNAQSIYHEPNLEKRSFQVEINEQMNKQVRAFFRRSQNLQSNQRNIQTSKLKVFYGFGPTILALKNIRLDLTPQPKDADLFIVELLINQRCPQKYRSCIMPYKILKEAQIKFAIQLKKIGEFVPLRFWKVIGVQNVQVGIVDILFPNNLKQQCQGYSPTKQPIELSPQNLHDLRLTSPYTEFQVNKQGKKRILFKNSLQTLKLRTEKLDEKQSQVSLGYVIYCKKYK